MRSIDRRCVAAFEELRCCRSSVVGVARPAQHSKDRKKRATPKGRSRLSALVVARRASRVE
jgi:hypothetical protein